MFRISINNEAKDTIILYLEGKGCYRYLKELQAEIKKGMDGDKKVILDFSKVTFLDEEAAEMINRFPSNRINKRNCSLFIRSVLQMGNQGEK